MTHDQTAAHSTRSDGQLIVGGVKNPSEIRPHVYLRSTDDRTPECHLTARQVALYETVKLAVHMLVAEFGWPRGNLIVSTLMKRIVLFYWPHDSNPAAYTSKLNGLCWNMIECKGRSGSSYVVEDVAYRLGSARDGSVSLMSDSQLRETICGMWPRAENHEAILRFFQLKSCSERYGSRPLIRLRLNPPGTTAEIISDHELRARALQASGVVDVGTAESTSDTSEGVEGDGPDHVGTDTVPDSSGTDDGGVASADASHSSADDGIEPPDSADAVGDTDDAGDSDAVNDSGGARVLEQAAVEEVAPESGSQPSPATVRPQRPTSRAAEPQSALTEEAVDALIERRLTHVMGHIMKRLQDEEEAREEERMAAERALAQAREKERDARMRVLVAEALQAALADGEDTK